jgi:hypothetical protein
LNNKPKNEGSHSGAPEVQPLTKIFSKKREMSFEFIQIPVNGQSSAKEELNKLLRGGRIASVKKEFVSNGEDSFWAFCVLSEQQREQLPRREPQQQQPGQQQQQHRVPLRPQLRPMGMDFPAMSQMGLNRLPSRSHPATGRDKNDKKPARRW